MTRAEKIEAAARALLEQYDRDKREITTVMRLERKITGAAQAVMLDYEPPAIRSLRAALAALDAGAGAGEPKGWLDKRWESESFRAAYGKASGEMAKWEEGFKDGIEAASKELESHLPLANRDAKWMLVESIKVVRALSPAPSAEPDAGAGKPIRFPVEVSRRTDDEGTLSFDAPGFTTVRPCRHCGVLMAGGPTACLACVRHLGSRAAPPAPSAAKILNAAPTKEAAPWSISPASDASSSTSGTAAPTDSTSPSPHPPSSPRSPGTPSPSACSTPTGSTSTGTPGSTPTPVPAPGAGLRGSSPYLPGCGCGLRTEPAPSALADAGGCVDPDCNRKPNEPHTHGGPSSAPKEGKP